MAINILRKILFVLVSTVFCGCSIQQLGYFEAQPYAKPFLNKVGIPMNIVLLEDVKDTVSVEGSNVKYMIVNEFRSSFGKTLKNTLDKNFNWVAIYDEMQDSGLSLVVYRVKPFWKMNGQTSAVYGTGGNTYSSTTVFVSAAFKYETTLYLNGEKLNIADGTVYSEQQMSSIYQAHPVFIDGLAETCEEINRKIFTDEVVQRISK